MNSPIDDPVLNCLLEVCCTPEAQAARLASVLVEREVCDETCAPKIAAFFAAHFDLAPKGTLKEFKHAVARVALARRPEVA